MDKKREDEIRAMSTEQMIELAENALFDMQTNVEYCADKLPRLIKETLTEFCIRLADADDKMDYATTHLEYFS